MPYYIKDPKSYSDSRSAGEDVQFTRVQGLGFYKGLGFRGLGSRV